MLMEVMPSFPRELSIAEKQLSGDEATLSVQMGDRTEEATMKRHEGAWKLASGLLF